jgi:peroxiredoxin
MQQAEIGSARITEIHNPPNRGYVMRDFTLPSTEGTRVGLYDYRGRANLILVFAGDLGQAHERRLIFALAQRFPDIREQDTEVLLVLTCPPDVAKNAKEQVNLPFPVLVDESAEIHRSVGSLGAKNVPATAVYVTDRFLEVFAKWRTAEGENLPDVEEIVSWATYVNSQCPECTQIEWPTSD